MLLAHTDVKDFNNLIYQRAVWRETFMYGSVQGQLNDRM